LGIDGNPYDPADEDDVVTALVSGVLLALERRVNADEPRDAVQTTIPADILPVLVKLAIESTGKPAGQLSLVRGQHIDDEAGTCLKG
jgi:hypothetical protein